MPPVPGADVAALPTHLLLVLAALSGCLSAQGGYYARGLLVMGVLLAAGLVTAVRARPLSVEDFRLGPIVACAALAGWTLVTVLTVGGNAAPVLALLICFCAVLLVCRRASAAERELLAGALVVIGSLVALSGWVGVAWRVEPLALNDQGLWRAATTLTYANAAAGFLVPMALLSLGRQLARRPTPTRAIVTCTLLVGVGATLSRGGALALVAGLATLAVLAGIRRTVRALVPAALGGVVALAGLAPSMPTGSHARPALAFLALAGGIALAAVLERAPARLLAATVVLMLGAAAALTLGPLEEAWQSVADSRLTLLSADRRAEAKAAFRLAAERPLTGTGPGRATLFFDGADGEPLAARYVHNEYLQVLIELGAVGLVLFLVVLGALARTVGAGRASMPSPQLWIGASSALVALSVHSAFDFLWHVPALPLTAALLVGLTIRIAPTRAKEHA